MINIDNVQNEQAYRLVLIRPVDLTVLVTFGPDGPELPRVELKTWARQAGELQRAIDKLWGLNSVLLEILPAGADALPCAIAEIISEFSDVRLTFAKLAEIRLESVDDYVRIEKFLAGDSHAHGPLSRPGWVARARRWIEETIPDRPASLAEDVRQLNAGGGFALMRFRTCAGRAYWLKATGDPNRHEFGVMSVLSGRLPHFLPAVLAMRQDWNAWLMEDGGTPLCAHLSLAAWERAVSTLASLQQESISHIWTLLDSGCRDQRLFVLLDHLDEMIDYLEAAMAQQTSTKVPPLERAQMKAIQSALREACLSTAASGIPDTLIHGDINPGNILFQDGRCVFIDWAEGYIGNPLVTFERLMVHLANLSDDASKWTPHLRSIYGRRWLDRLSACAIDQAFAAAPLLAIATYLYGRGDWLRSSRRYESAFQKHARCLARHMYRASQRPGLGEASCR